MKHTIITTILIIISLAVGAFGGYYLRATTSQPQTASTSQTTTTSGTSSSQVATTRCQADDLTASLSAAEGGAAAGNRYYDLTVKNGSNASCTIEGYPGVSLTDAQGVSVGSAAEHDTTKAAASITLAPSEAATATLHLSVSDNYPSGTCKDGATNVKVYPPDDTGYLLTPTSSANVTTWCPGFTTTTFTHT